MGFTDAMSQNCGTYNSYLKGTTYARQLEGNLYLLIEPLDTHVARVRFEERADNAPAQPVPIPAGYQLVDGETLTPAARRADKHFIIAWFADYLLTRQNEGTVLKIFNKKEQAIQAV